MTTGFIVLAVALLVGAAAGLAVIASRPLLERAERHRRARLVTEARRDIRGMAREASRARYELLVRRQRP